MIDTNISSDVMSDLEKLKEIYNNDEFGEICVERYNLTQE